jgi:hypothetical protein
MVEVRGLCEASTGGVRLCGQIRPKVGGLPVLAEVLRQVIVLMTSP